MTKKASNQAVAEHTPQDLDPAPSAGPDGIAVAPPSYGIDFLDRTQSGGGPSGGLALQREADPGIAGNAPTTNQDNSIYIGKVGPFDIWIKTFADLSAFLRLGIVELKRDLDGTFVSESVRTRGQEWIKLAEDWESSAQSRGSAALDPVTSGMVRPLLNDLPNIRQEVARLKQQAQDASDLQMANRARAAAEEAAARVKELEPELNREMREAFRKEKVGPLEKIASRTATIVDVALRLHDLGKEISEKISRGEKIFEEIKEVAEPLEKLSKGLAIVTAAFALTGEKKATALEEGTRWIEIALELFASATALAGENLAPHIGLYVNVYLLPLVKKILEEMEVLVDELHDLNKEWVQFTGEPRYKGAEPGEDPIEMFNFMSTVMNAKEPQDIPAVPERVAGYLISKRELLTAGTGADELPVRGIFSKSLIKEEISDWLFYNRKNVWAMLYGDLPVRPREKSNQDSTGVKPGSSGHLQRLAVNASPIHEVPSSVDEVLRSPGEPLDSNTLDFMESRFGHDFSNVRVHTDSKAAESARAVNAKAYTVGRDIAFANGQYSPTTNEGRRLVAHELTHVVQQRGSKAAAATEIAPADESFEREARQASDRLFSSPQPAIPVTPQVLPVIQRFEIEGPFDFNDPVHETITEEALRKAGLLKPGGEFTDPGVWEYIRGVMWNDDPEGLLFDANKNNTNDYSSGIAWYRKFKDAEKKSAKGTRFGPLDDLIPRSHFGDLQFIHGMASQDKEPAAFTQGNIMLWAEFSYKVATGQIPGTTRVGDVSISGIPELFPRMTNETISFLFGIENLGSITQRASGSLMHLIQDSYASGHVQREAMENGKKGKIISFHSYGNQDHKKHGKYDAFQGEGSDVEKLKNIPGALEAVDQSAQVLKFISEKRAWEDVKLYLEMEVFGLVPNPLEAGAGNEFLKEGAAKEPEYMPPAPSLPGDAGDYEMSRRTAV